jgi:hypothetical protein
MCLQKHNKYFHLYADILVIPDFCLWCPLPDISPPLSELPNDCTTFPDRTKMMAFPTALTVGHIPDRESFRAARFYLTLLSQCAGAYFKELLVAPQCGFPTLFPPLPYQFHLCGCPLPYPAPLPWQWHHPPASMTHLTFIFEGCTVQVPYYGTRECI